MNKQGKYTKADILDLSEMYYSYFDCDSTSWLCSTEHSQKQGKAIKNLKRDQKVQKNHFQGAHGSAEELKIRGEMEKEIERDLEEEIKEGIYQHASRLHRLYQHQKERNAKEASESGDEQDNRSRAVSEVIISIRMEGGTKIEIKEEKKEANGRVHPRNSRIENVKGVPAKKFDWAKTLRSDSGPVAKSRRLTAKLNATSDKKQLQLGWKV